MDMGNGGSLLQPAKDLKAADTAILSKAGCNEYAR
jgi:hypothetical protein